MPEINQVFVRYLDGSSEMIPHRSLQISAVALTLIGEDSSRLTIPIGRIAFTKDMVPAATPPAVANPLPKEPFNG